MLHFLIGKKFALNEEFSQIFSHVLTETKNVTFFQKRSLCMVVYACCMYFKWLKVCVTKIRASFYQRFRTFEITHEILTDNTENCQNSHENEKNFQKFFSLAIVNPSQPFYFCRLWCPRALFILLFLVCLCPFLCECVMSMCL